MLRAAVERQFEIIGEAFVHLRRLAPERLARNELSFSRMSISYRHSRERGNLGASEKTLTARWPQPIDPAVQLPWTPAFAGVTVTH
jgi:hypothetical protein